MDLRFPPLSDVSLPAGIGEGTNGRKEKLQKELLNEFTFPGLFNK